MTSRKAISMTAQRCTCGFTEADEVDETVVDHLLWVFTPQGDTGADGRVHLEGTSELTCLCGFRAGMAEELDSHFLEMFIPADGIDSGGVEHKVIALRAANRRPAVTWLGELLDVLEDVGVGLLLPFGELVPIGDVGGLMVPNRSGADHPTFLRAGSRGRP
jgi:hypothetical protein